MYASQKDSTALAPSRQPITIATIRPAGSSTDVPGPQPVSCQRPVTNRGTQGEGDQNCEPIEQLSRPRDDAVDRQGPLAREPNAEDDGQGRREDARAHGERNTQIIREDVGVERASHAEHDDRQPVDERHIAVEAQLPAQNHGEYHREDERGRVQTDTQSHVDPVGEALTHGRAQDLDDPEPHRDLGHLAQPDGPCVGSVDGPRSRCLSHIAGPYRRPAEPTLRARCCGARLSVL